MSEPSWTDLDGIKDANGHIWTPTVMLRRISRGSPREIPWSELQQAWRRKDTGELDWRDIESAS